jgi:hypothetical protein
MAALANQCRIGRPPLLRFVAPAQRFAVANMAYRNNWESRCCGSVRSGLLCLRLLQEKGLQFARSEHLRDDVTAAYEFAVDVVAESSANPSNP